ncbi:MAG: helix-turn-helix domain-containing protein [Blastocatellia bacterium]
MHEETLNLNQAAEFLNVSQRKLWLMQKAGEIEALVNPLDKREKRFRKADLLKLTQPTIGAKGDK